jgi:hypothetical protein
MPGELPPVRSDGDLVTSLALERRSSRPRRCALLHVGQAWDEKLDALRGRGAQKRVGAPGAGRHSRASTEGSGCISRRASAV